MSRGGDALKRAPTRESPYKGKSERERTTRKKEKGELCEPQLARRYDNRLKIVCKQYFWAPSYSVSTIIIGKASGLKA